MERETQLEIGVGVLGVGSFILALVVIGTQYGGDGLSEAGGTALIGAMVGFVLFMSMLGYWLSRQRA
jgi:lipopolysaccharide export LptBFGC system permease protein LptF